MNKTSTTTNPAVLAGSTNGPIQLKAGSPDSGWPETTTGCVTVPLGAVVDADVLLDLVERGLQPLDGAAAARPAHVPDLLPDVGAIGNKVGAQAAHLSHDRPGREPQTGEHERHHDEDRWPRVRFAAEAEITGGVSTKVMRIARLTGTRTACAQWRTATTSAQPAKVVQLRSELSRSTMRRRN